MGRLSATLKLLLLNIYEDNTTEQQALKMS
jgi:hypothetical protein